MHTHTPHPLVSPFTFLSAVISTFLLLVFFLALHSSSLYFPYQRPHSSSLCCMLHKLSLSLSVSLSLSLFLSRSPSSGVRYTDACKFDVTVVHGPTWQVRLFCIRAYVYQPSSRGNPRSAIGPPQHAPPSNYGRNAYVWVVTRRGGAKPVLFVIGGNGCLGQNIDCSLKCLRRDVFSVLKPKCVQFTVYFLLYQL